MQFTWGFGCANVAKTINTMIKYKSGGWTSFKQQSYVSSRLLPVADAAFPRDAANAKMFGVELHDGEFGMILEGYTKWADYGRKSIRGIGDFGRMYLSVFETNEGNVIMYHNCLRGGLEGNTYNVNFTVKKHILTYKNEKVTVASRMGFSTNQKLLNRIAA
jgi:hypothetical protein